MKWYRRGTLHSASSAGWNFHLGITLFTFVASHALDVDATVKVFIAG
jgi:hypothetical protein